MKYRNLTQAQAEKIAQDTLQASQSELSRLFTLAHSTPGELLEWSREEKCWRSLGKYKSIFHIDGVDEGHIDLYRTCAECDNGRVSWNGLHWNTSGDITELKNGMGGKSFLVKCTHKGEVYIYGNQKDTAEKFGFSTTTLRQYINGERVLNIQGEPVHFESGLMAQVKR